MASSSRVINVSCQASAIEEGGLLAGETASLAVDAQPQPHAPGALGGSFLFGRRRRIAGLVAVGTVAAMGVVALAGGFQGSSSSPASGGAAFHSAQSASELQQLGEEPCLGSKEPKSAASADPCKPPSLLLDPLEHEKKEDDKNAVSLFCWCVMLTWGYEVDMIRAQHSADSGVFGCDAWSVFSLESVEIGPGMNSTAIPGPPARWDSPPGKNYRMNMNTNVFLRAWRALAKAGVYKNHDWVIKADVDAVFFPSLLAAKMGSQQWAWANQWKAAVYVKNCWAFKSMQGPLELLSRTAFDRFVTEGIDKCQAWMPLNELGEDQFVDKCLHKLGIQSVNDFALVSDTYCGGGSQPCHCSGAAAGTLAFHPCKSVDSYFKCMEVARPGATAGLQ